MLVLVPPSEGKAAGGRGAWAPADGAFADLGPARAAAVAALAAAARRRDAPKVLGVRGEHLERARGALADADAGRAPALPAWRRYTGVVWANLDPATLPAAARRRLLVPSALAGLSRGDDPLPDFRGKLSAVVPRLGRLDRWWRPHVTDVLRRLRGPVVDLLPSEHAAAVSWGDLGGDRTLVRVRFVAAGGAGAAGHAAKAVKGRVARVVVLDGPDALDDFEWEGWTVRRTPSGADVVAPG